MKNSWITRAWILASLCLILCLPQKAMAFGITDNQAAVVGKILNYEESCDTFTIYGRRSIMSNYGWQIVETQKFYHVIPTNAKVRQNLNQNIGLGVKVFGVSQTVNGLREQNLLADNSSPYNPEADRAAGVSAAFGPAEGPFDWIGFGVANRPTYLSTIQLKDRQQDKITGFVNILASLRDALFNCNGEKGGEHLADKKTAYIQSVINGSQTGNASYSNVFRWWKSNINTNWFLEKNLDVLNDLNNAAGGFAFYKGKTGSNGGYVEEVPIIRPDLDKFMNSSSSGGNVVLESTSGIFLGEFTYSNETKETYLTGPFYKHSEDMISDIVRVKNGQQSLSSGECWKAAGLSPDRRSTLLGKKCWVSGRKVLVYEKGILIDYYFSVDKTLSLAEFNSALNFIRDISLKGGI